MSPPEPEVVPAGLAREDRWAQPPLRTRGRWPPPEGPRVAIVGSRRPSPYGVAVAVMGTGVDIVYPAAHSRLAEDILAAGGALVSQFPDGTAPRRHNFPARNLTMAALSDAVVVVEAVQGSGALIT